MIGTADQHLPGTETGAAALVRLTMSSSPNRPASDEIAKAARSFLGPLRRPGALLFVEVVSQRAVLGGIIYVLRAGVPSRLLPPTSSAAAGA